MEGMLAHLLCCNEEEWNKEVYGYERPRNRNHFNTVLWLTDWNYGFIHRYLILVQA